MKDHLLFRCMEKNLTLNYSRVVCFAQHFVKSHFLRSSKLGRWQDTQFSQQCRALKNFPENFGNDEVDAKCCSKSSGLKCCEHTQDDFDGSHFALLFFRKINPPFSTGYCFWSIIIVERNDMYRNSFLSVCCQSTTVNNTSLTHFVAILRQKPNGKGKQCIVVYYNFYMFIHQGSSV